MSRTRSLPILFAGFLLASSGFGDTAYAGDDFGSRAEMRESLTELHDGSYRRLREQLLPELAESAATNLNRVAEELRDHFAACTNHGDQLIPEAFTALNTLMSSVTPSLLDQIDCTAEATQLTATDDRGACRSGHLSRISRTQMVITHPESEAALEAHFHADRPESADSATLRDYVSLVLSRNLATCVTRFAYGQEVKVCATMTVDQARQGFRVQFTDVLDFARHRSSR